MNNALAKKRYIYGIARRDENILNIALDNGKCICIYISLDRWMKRVSCLRGWKGESVKGLWGVMGQIHPSKNFLKAKGVGLFE